MVLKIYYLLTNFTLHITVCYGWMAGNHKYFSKHFTFHMIGQKLILTLNFRLVSIISKLAQIQHIWTKIEETLACTITFRPQMICFLNSKDRTASKLGQFEPFLVQRELAQWRVVHRTAPNATFTGRTQRPPRNSFKRNTSHSAQNSWKGIYGFGWTLQFTRL